MKRNKRKPCPKCRSRLREGKLENINRWVAEKVLGGEAAPPQGNIIQEDDYVIMGGIILPKSKENLEK